MASFAFFDIFTTAQTLADGEFGVIGDTGSLRVTGATRSPRPARSRCRSTARCSGATSAIDVDRRNSSCSLSARSGRIAAGDDTVLDRGRRPGLHLQSPAASDRSSDALDIRGGGPITILNTGTLFGRSDGIVTESEALADADRQPGHDRRRRRRRHRPPRRRRRPRQPRDDRGPGLRLRAADPADGDTPDEDEVRNFGSIEGGVFLYALDDFVENRGEIDFIDLGGGDDIYFGRGTGSAGSVDGGGGGDLLVSSRADDTFIGGGAGDVFIFLRRGGADRILDFGGTDRIDLSVFELASFRADIRDRIEERPNGSLIDFSDDGLTIFLRGVDKADVRASDFILEPPIM